MCVRTCGPLCVCDRAPVHMRVHHVRARTRACMRVCVHMCVSTADAFSVTTGTPQHLEFLDNGEEILPPESPTPAWLEEAEECSETTIPDSLDPVEAEQGTTSAQHHLADDTIVEPMPPEEPAAPSTQDEAEQIGPD